MVLRFGAMEMDGNRCSLLVAGIMKDTCVFMDSAKIPNTTLTMEISTPIRLPLGLVFPVMMQSILRPTLGKLLTSASASAAD